MNDVERLLQHARVAGFGTPAEYALELEDILAGVVYAADRDEAGHAIDRARDLVDSWRYPTNVRTLRGSRP